MKSRALEDLLGGYLSYLEREVGWPYKAFFVPSKRKKVMARSYTELLHYLLKIPFYYDVRNFPRDENRKLDGQRLRENYLVEEENIPLSSELGQQFLAENDGCSVLEMLLALSKRADLEYLGDGSGEGKADLFWVMLDNLGLLEFPNWRFSERKVGEIVEDFLDRVMDSDGNGGLFPLKKEHPDPEKQRNLSEIDQRKREIWDQMMSFFYERSD